MVGKKSAKQLIEESMTELTAQMPIERITVRAIVENCGVSRQAFYNCFSDKFALADAIYEEQVTRVIDDHPADAPLGTVLLDLLHGISFNEVIYRNSYCRRDDISGFIEINRRVFRQLVSARVAGELDDDDLFMVDFLADAFAHRMALWVSGGMVETPEQMRDLIVRCVPNGLAGRMRLG